MGLLLGKQGPTDNNASGGASVKYSPNTDTAPLFLTELGYDIRIGDGSHCGAGAPRFNVVTTDGDFYAVGCNSGTTTTTSAHWTRLRWGDGATVGSVMGYLNNVTLAPITGRIKSIDLVFDEGSGDPNPPPNSGIAILDNIDVNKTLGGK